jgi:hypothetical protein
VSDTDLMYAERDHVAQGEHYLRHIDAMTREGLHTKSAIAAELAHRDIEIARLMAERDAARADGMRAAASILDAEHDKRSHIDNHAAYYARMIREAIGR